MTGPSRFRTIVLIASLMTNALIAGVVIGGYAAGLRVASVTAERSDVREGRGGRGRLDVSPRALIGSLPEEYRRDAIAVLRSQGGDGRALLRERFDARRAVQSALRAEPFDREAALNALDRYADAEIAVRRRGGRIVVDIIEGLPPEVRRDLGERMAEGRRSRWRRGPRFRDREPPPPDGE